MTRSAKWGIGFSLIAAISLAASPAFGQERAPQSQIFSTFAGPAGVVESIGGVSLDGRAVQGREAIWGGELIEVGANTGARIQLHAAGQVTLPAGARARLAVTTDPKSSRAVLIASLMSGAMAVTLQPAALAYVEAGRSAYTASEGASFRLTLREGKAVIAIAGGVVREETKIPQQKPIISPVGIGRGFTRTKTNGVEQRQYKITRPKGPRGPSVSGESALADPCPKSEDLQGDPVPAGTPVRFELAPGTPGTVTPPVTATDANGIVTVNYRAGARTGKGKLLITAEDKEASTTCEWDVQVMSPLWFWTVQHKALVAIGAAAAAAVPTVIVTTRDDKRIRPIPPPVVTP